MNPTVSLILGIIGAIVLTVLLYIKVLPRKMDGNLNNKYLQFLHDFFHFKKLYLEEVLKGIFVFATISCVVIGALMLITVDVYEGYYRTYTTWYGGYGLLLMIGGPVCLRLVYESIMMFILLVKNTIEINNKVQAPNACVCEAPEAEAPVAEAPAAPVQQEPSAE